MTEQEARDRCAQLAAEDPDRNTHSWVPREGADGEWSIVKLAVPTPGTRIKNATTAEDVQGLKDDPRTALRRNVGGGYGT